MNLQFEISGKGEIALIIETAMGSIFEEWSPILKPLSDQYLIFQYNRAGYGKSDESESERSPKNIAKQLNDLVASKIPHKKYIIISHSIGALYAEQYIRDYHENIIGAIFLDPVTSNDYRFKKELTHKEFNSAGFNKWPMIKTGLTIGRLGMLKLFKPLFKKSIPFYYYKNYDKNSVKEILNNMTQLKLYRTMRKEYKFYENLNESNIKLNSFPQIPVRVLHHNSDIMINEMKHFGNLNFDACKKADSLWLEVMSEYYSKLSENYKFENAENSSHFIHLTDKEKLYNVINEISMQRKI